MNVSYMGLGDGCLIRPRLVLAAASQAADEAAARVEDSLGDEGPPELDEFGRNVNMQREREARERR